MPSSWWLSQDTPVDSYQHRSFSKTNVFISLDWFSTPSSMESKSHLCMPSNSCCPGLSLRWQKRRKPNETVCMSCCALLRTKLVLCYKCYLSAPRKDFEYLHQFEDYQNKTLAFKAIIKRSNVISGI